MILNRNFYSKISVIKARWYRWQSEKLQERLYRAFRLYKTEWPGKLYFYSPRLKRLPIYTGNKDLLSSWKEAAKCERICPTSAIRVTAESIIIDERGCIACGLCVELAPEGLLEMTSEIPFKHINPL